MLNKPLRTSRSFWLALGTLSLLAGALAWVQCKIHPRLAAVPVKSAFVVQEGQHNAYTTSFLRTEQPISEDGKWVSGRAAGIDWADVNTTIGLAYGTEFGKGTGDGVYDDSTALLTGAWEADQTVEAEVRSTRPSDYDFEEVELRLRSSLSSHNATGYEVLFRCSKTANAYASIARWDGQLGKFTYLIQKKGLGYGVADGDIVKATAVGNVITGYINDVEVVRATDNTYRQGSPGMGFWFKKSSSRKFWLSKGAGVNTDFGFRRFAAWD